MLDTTLSGAVERFAHAVQHIPDADLERPWAWGAYDSEGVRFAFFRTYEELRELAVKTEARRAVPLSSAQRLLGAYHAAYRDLQAALIGITPEQADRAPAPEEWSLRRTAGHIVGAEVGFFVVTHHGLDRLRGAPEQPAEIPDAVWEALLGDEATLRATLEGPLPGIQAYHAELHQRVLTAFAAIGEEELEAPSLYWEGYELSLRFRLGRFDSHLRQHTIQVDKILAASGAAPAETQRLLRLTYAALAAAEGATIGAWQAAAELRQEAAERISARADELAQILTESEEADR